MDEPGEEIDDVKGGQLADGEVLMLKRRFDEIAEVFRRRFAVQERLGHEPIPSLTASQSNLSGRNSPGASRVPMRYGMDLPVFPRCAKLKR
jgi:hypothetical protein